MKNLPEMDKKELVEFYKFSAYGSGSGKFWRIFNTTR